jgi:hypothetical protein
LGNRSSRGLAKSELDLAEIAAAHLRGLEPAGDPLVKSRDVV